MHDRIKYLRKELLHLTQEEFANSLKISRSNLGSIEIGRVNLTDRIISDICEKFNVNENWLRTGEGETFLKLDREAEIAQLAATLFKDEEDSFRTRLILTLANLNSEELKLLEKIALEIVEIKKD